jgi:hypothetical protein
MLGREKNITRSLWLSNRDGGKSTEQKERGPANRASDEFLFLSALAFRQL